ncbi:hypothetical protein WG915_07535 [Corynebacterium sp. H128]|uniref:hypothetical protein n=1 Tax=Corynebacterium sp. H128 TaxID=3133427 RepID=UPI0030B077ED
MDSYTWCFFTKFVCKRDQLVDAKKRHRRCAEVLNEDHDVLFQSEQAHDLGKSEPLFSLLLSEIVGSETNLSEAEKDEYSLFCFVAIVNVLEKDDDEVRKVSLRLEIDFEEDFPARFPSRTRGIIISPDGKLTDSCISQ